MKVEIYNENIVHLSFPTQKELTLTMCRPQEFYESANSDLCGKVFTFEQFIDASMDDEGSLDYFTFWSGFNIPGPILEEFFSKFDLSRREQAIRDATLMLKDKLYYVISTLDTDTLSLRHELAHAYYYLSPSYKQSVDVLIRHMSITTKNILITELKDMGYADAVMNDEINAYLATSTDEYIIEGISCDISEHDRKPFIDLAKTTGVFL